MNLSLAKTNSWHWLAAAVIVAAGAAVWLWIDHVSPAIRQQNFRERQLQVRLSGLQMLDISQAERLREEEKNWQKRRTEATEAYNQLGIEQLPASSEAAFALKNRIDAALAARGLRVIANEIAIDSLQNSSAVDATKGTQKDTSMPSLWTSAPPYPTDEFRYSVIGSFRNMFLFLWLETNRKTSYHLKNFDIRHTRTGDMQLDFILQVSHR